MIDYFFLGYGELLQEARTFQRDAYSDNSKVARKSQVNKYITFINSFGGLLSPFPCSTEQVCVYIAYLAKTCKYSSIRQYLSALNNLLRSMSYPPIDYSSYQIQTCLKGALRTLGGEAKIAKPLLPSELVLIFECLSNSRGHNAFRAAMLVCFRALLRKCQITASASTLLRRDITFTKWGMIITVRRSKSIQFKERCLEIPVAALSNNLLCAVYWLRKHFSEVPAPSDSPIIIIPAYGSLPYHVYESTLKLFSKKAGLNPDHYSSHSLRRGGATFLSISGSSIQEIKHRGDWASSCVYKYISTPLEGRILDDLRVADVLSNFTL